MTQPERSPTAPWDMRVAKIQRYWLEVNAMTRPTQVQEKPAPYGKGSGL